MVVRELNQARPVDATLDQRLSIRIRSCVMANRNRPATKQTPRGMRNLQRFSSGLNRAVQRQGKACGRGVGARMTRAPPRAHYNTETPAVTFPGRTPTCLPSYSNP